MTDYTIIVVTEEQYEQIVELASTHRADVDEARDRVLDLMFELGLDPSANGVTTGSEEGRLLYFGAPMFTTNIAHTDDYYGMFDEEDETIVYDAGEDGIAFNLDAAMEGEVEEIDEDFDLERIQVYHGDADLIFNAFDWFESPPDDPELYKELVAVVYTSFHEAIEE